MGVCTDHGANFVYAGARCSDLVHATRALWRAQFGDQRRPARRDGVRAQVLTVYYPVLRIVAELPASVS